MNKQRRGFRQERDLDWEKANYLDKLAEDKEGRTALKFQERLQKIHDWLQNNKTYFTAYKLAEKEFADLATIENRKPRPEHLTTLNLDVTPKIGEAIKNLRKAKRTYYEAIRSADGSTHHHSKNQLDLTMDERRKIMPMLNEFCEKCHIDRADFETLLFPDIKFSLTEEEIADPHKKVDFPFLENFFSINSALSELSSLIRAKVNKSKGNS